MQSGLSRSLTQDPRVDGTRGDPVLPSSAAGERDDGCVARGDHGAPGRLRL